MATPRKAAKKTTGDTPTTPKNAGVGTPLISGYNWAVNTVKLNRSIAFVRAGAAESGLKENTPEFEAAVKARYVEIAGLLSEDARPAKGKKNGRVVNLAEDDGSEDDEDDKDEDA